MHIHVEILAPRFMPYLLSSWKKIFLQQFFIYLKAVIVYSLNMFSVGETMPYL